jgi:hypothetical protein
LTPSLTRLLEGLRKYEVDDPRARLVEKVFKRHDVAGLAAGEPPARAEAHPMRAFDRGRPSNRSALT